VLYGLVLAGGQSRRMGRDKASLTYGGVTQSRRCLTLLSEVCQKVFLSNRREQSYEPGHHNLPQIHDVYEGIGPLGGILSAMQAYPNAAWLVLACDMPCVDAPVLHDLVSRRDPAKPATVFHDETLGFDEPLCTIYEPSCWQSLQSAAEQGCLSPRDILARLEIQRLVPPNAQCLIGMNTPEEYRQVWALHDKRLGPAR
jgi:molybdenum cofactor guanylyltransferase